DAFIEDIQREALRLTRLTDSLLTLARLGSGELVPREEHLDVGGVTRSVTALMLPLAHGAGLTLTAEGTGTVQADRDLLEQVLIGLVGNAIKHTPRGGSITVRVAPRGSVVAVTVEDTGAGIAAPDLAHVFDRFWRGDSSRQAGGYG